MNSDTQQIVDLLKTYETAANSSDHEALGAIYTKDAVLFPDRFEAFEGAEAIMGFYQMAFSALTLKIEFAIDPKQIILAGETAYATTTSIGTRYIIEADQTVPEINRELWVFNKAASEWKIARYCFNKSE